MNSLVHNWQKITTVKTTGSSAIADSNLTDSNFLTKELITYANSFFLQDDETIRLNFV